MRTLITRTALTTIPAAVLLGSAGLLAGFAPANTGATGAVVAEEASLASYTVDPVHSTVLFGIRHAGVSNFYGVFTDFSGSFTFDPASPESGEFGFEVQTASVDTRNSSRDDHLRNADFFNARQFPTITFASTGVELKEGNLYALKGDLTMQGETRPITAELEWIGTGTNQRGQGTAGYEARFEIKRSDFGMTKYLAPDGSDSGGLGNTVKLTVAVEAVQE
ncbi:MAG: YceI family protein [Planctomycetota bacterium]|nr:MAG: YceI family protein [Planctomycetota bacterium]